MRSLLWLTQAL